METRKVEKVEGGNVPQQAETAKVEGDFVAQVPCRRWSCGHCLPILLLPPAFCGLFSPSSCCVGLTRKSVNLELSRVITFYFSVWAWREISFDFFVWASVLDWQQLDQTCGSPESEQF